MPARSNQVRIIAGQWRGRKLTFPDSAGLRPTADRIRETLFNWLMPVLPGASCLDLFAGSGALGFEAASRGAASVVLVERDAVVVSALRENRQRLSAQATQVIQQDARNYLAGPPRPFDVVFLDPPFARAEQLQHAVEDLSHQDWLKRDARIYLETAAKAPPLSLPEGWRLLKQKQAGQVRYQLYLVDKDA